MLIVMDGWGEAPASSANAISAAHTPNVNGFYESRPYARLRTSGEDVGLPEGQMGNSEVGHLNIGAGRVVYQELALINKAIREKTIDTNPELLRTFEYCKSQNKPLHLNGLVSDGGVHSHIDHLVALCRLAYSHSIPKVVVHAFTDGRDTDPKSGLGYLTDLQQHLDTTVGVIASVTGRYYAMDRDKRWERVKLAYDALVNGIGETTTDVLSTLATSYENGVTDEFLKPLINSNTTSSNIKDGDAVICFNFRTDRGREITQALTQRDFHEENMHKMNLYYLTMTEYDKEFQNVHVIFNDSNLPMTMGEVLEGAGKKQIRIAETEKYPHVTFFFSGGREALFTGQQNILRNSPKVATYDLQPEMSAADLRDALIPELEKEEVDFVCLNFANPDMVGHTGVFSAVVKAVETVDACAEAVVTAGLAHGYSFIIIADHGNADVMMNEDGSPNTAHSTNLVPCILVDNDFKPELRDGKLGDVSPTILKLMGVAQPKEMTGVALF